MAERQIRYVGGPNDGETTVLRSEVIHHQGINSETGDPGHWSGVYRYDREADVYWWEDASGNSAIGKE